jgi:lipoate-protein ligase A
MNQKLSTTEHVEGANGMKYPKTTWRLIETPPANGCWNMAVDEAILKAVSEGDSIPTLRLYAWTPPCLSLGYAQPISDVDFKRVISRGWDLVRRPTGGRAILHTDELTYSVIGPHSEIRLSGGVLESYQRIATGLVKAINLLNAQAQALENLPGSNLTGSNNPVCFETPSNYEITVKGKKIIGSAQARRREGILQHGSLPLFGDLTRITSVLSFTDEVSRSQAAKRLLEHATTLENVLETVPSWETITQAFVDGFQETLNLEFVPGSLSEKEQTQADQLVKEKYNSPEWSYRI